MPEVTVYGYQVQSSNNWSASNNAIGPPNNTGASVQFAGYAMGVLLDQAPEIPTDATLNRVYAGIRWQGNGSNQMKVTIRMGGDQPPVTLSNSTADTWRDDEWELPQNAGYTVDGLRAGRSTSGYQIRPELQGSGRVYADALWWRIVYNEVTAAPARAKRFDGAWQDSVIKKWDGTSWVPAEVKGRWSGSAWE